MWPFRDPKTAIPTFDVDNTIAAGSRVLGDLSGPGGFRIDGAVEGDITVDGPVIIGEGGAVEGAVRGRTVVVLGRVCGDVTATGHLEIGPKGKVVGDITVQSFRMHVGGVFRGASCMPGGDEAEPALLMSMGTPAAALETRIRTRTLPPPNGAVVPPPPVLTELADGRTGRASEVTDEAVSQQRLISTLDSASAKRSAM